MPWTGKYYYRSQRRNGRPCRIYVGTGEAGGVAAAEDLAIRKERESERARVAAARAETATLDADLDRFYRLSEAIFRACLITAGYHQHDRGAWRRKRGGD